MHIALEGAKVPRKENCYQVKSKTRKRRLTIATRTENQLEGDLRVTTFTLRFYLWEVSVSPFLSLSVHFCQCQSISVTVCPFLSMSVHFCHCQSISVKSVHFCQCQSISVIASPFPSSQSVSVNVSPFLSLPVRFCQICPFLSPWNFHRGKFQTHTKNPNPHHFCTSTVEVFTHTPFPSHLRGI